MNRGILTLIAAGLTASAAMATNINISVQQNNGTNAITVAPGETVNYKIVGTLTDNVNEGLALIGLSLDFTGGSLAQANTPAGTISCANPMPAFVVPQGIGNPGGYGGTVIGGNLIQIGGAQNTIKNTAGNAPYPILDPIRTGVAKPLPEGCGPAVIATGSLTAPNAAGQYFLNAFDVFANVITDNETGIVFWATEPAGFDPLTNLTNLTVNVGCVAAVGNVWESVASHLPNFPAGDVALVIPEDTTPGDNTDSPFSEPRSGVSKLVVTFSSGIDPATATPAAVSVAGRDSVGNPFAPATTIGTSVVASNTKLEITFTPALQNFAKYRVSLNGVATGCGAAVVTGNQRIFTALQGDASNDRRTNVTDVGGCRGLVGINPIDPFVVNQVRCDANDDGRLNATDIGGIRSVVGRDARFIVDP